jgi:hypothetical protein
MGRTETLTNAVVAGVAAWSGAARVRASTTRKARRGDFINGLDSGGGAHADGESGGGVADGELFDFGFSEIFAAKQRQENSGEEVEGAKSAAAGFGGIKPAGVV